MVRDPLRMMLFALTILTISRAHEAYPILAKLRPALLLVVGSVGYAYLNPRYLTRTNVLSVWPMRIVAMLAVIACASAAFGISLGGSANFILDSYVKTLAYCFLVALAIRHVRDLYTFVWAYVLSCGILAFFSIFVFKVSVGQSYTARLNNLYTYDSNDLCVVMMMGFPLTLLLLSTERGLKRWIALLMLVGISATIARSGSRGGFLGFIAVGVAALVLVKGISAGQRLLVVIGAVVALAVGAPDGYWRQMGTITTLESDYNFTDIDGRKAVMQRGIMYLGEYPVFGLGINNFSKAECTISPKISDRRINGPLRCTPPHNSFLQAAAETGTVGFLVWISLIIGGVIGPLRLRRRLPQSWRRGTHSQRFIYGAASFFPISMIGFAVPSFFVTFAWMDTVYFMAAALTGLYICAKRELAEVDSAGITAPAEISFDRRSGWRVRRSAWRFAVTARTNSSAHDLAGVRQT
jgi:O-antigen ligase